MSSSITNIILYPFLVLTLGSLLTAESPVKSKIHYPEQLTGPYTGGFGEQTCHHCHFDYPLNDNPGTLSVKGLSREFSPDSLYEITISTTRSGLRRAGFQMTARFSAGKQGGSFQHISDRTEFTGMEQSNVRYIQHSPGGTVPVSDERGEWKVLWRAPAAGSDTVYFHVAVNAGNGDASEFGDFINTKEIRVAPE